MAFWGKIFKKNNSDKNTSNVPVQNLEKETYQVFFSLSTEEEQKRVKEFIRPITDKWQVMNLKLAYGVRVEEEELFLIENA